MSRYVLNYEKFKLFEESQLTIKQESTSLLFFKNMIEKGKLPNETQIKRSYPEIDQSWRSSFKKQTDLLMDWWETIPQKNKYKYSHTKGFMKFIVDAIRRCGINKKDNWNPADVWLVDKNKEKEIQYNIRKILSDLKITQDKSIVIEKINTYMRKLFNDKDLIGISLKKTKAKTGKYKEYNTSDVQYDFSKSKIDLKNIQLIWDLNKKNKFQNVETYIDINFIDKKIIETRMGLFGDKHAHYPIRIQLKVKNDRSALGRVPVDIIDNWLEKYGFSRKQIVKNVIPTKNNSFEDIVFETKRLFGEIIKSPMAKKINFGNINSLEDFSIILDNLDVSKDEILRNLSIKLQSMYYIHFFIKLSESNELDDFILDIFLSSQKIGKLNGPFLKIS